MDKRELIERIEVLEEWTAREDEKRKIQDTETKTFSERDEILNKLKSIFDGEWEVNVSSHNSNITMYFEKIIKLMDERKVKLSITGEYKTFGTRWFFCIEETCTCSSSDIDNFIRKIKNTMIKLNDGKIEI